MYDFFIDYSKEKEPAENAPEFDPIPKNEIVVRIFEVCRRKKYATKTDAEMWEKFGRKAGKYPKPYVEGKIAWADEKNRQGGYAVAITADSLRRTIENKVYLAEYMKRNPGITLPATEEQEVAKIAGYYG